MKNKILRMTYAAMCLALCLYLPFLTGGIPELGKVFQPMHLPALLSGFLCGPVLGGFVGLAGPLLRFFLFGRPMMIDAIIMAFELCTYAAVTGLLHKVLPKKPIFVYIKLVLAMLAGRVVWAIVRLALFGLGLLDYSFEIFLTVGFVNAIPAIASQLLLVPILYFTLESARLTPEEWY